LENDFLWTPFFFLPNEILRDGDEPPFDPFAIFFYYKYFILYLFLLSYIIMDKLSKYSGNTSSQILTYLKRNFNTYEIKSSNYDWMVNPIKFVVVDEKSYLIDGNKKMLVNRIYNLIQDVFPTVDISILRRTIKMFLDGISDK